MAAIPMAVETGESKLLEWAGKCRSGPGMAKGSSWILEKALMLERCLLQDDIAAAESVWYS